MTILRNWALAVAACAALLAAAPAPATADALDDFRKQGAIAERWDGFVEARPGAPAAAASLVDDVNRKRREVYEKRATQEKVPMSEVGKIYASQIMKSAPSGTFFRQPDGQFVQR